MSEEMVRCGCCGKLVPTSNIELSFRCPDIVAALDEEARNQRCYFNDDIYVLDEQRFFFRCIMPLPVQERAEPYAIGAWAEVGRDEFKQIWGLWEDENQAQSAPIPAVLANSIPFTSGSENCAIELQLTGPDTRPEIRVLETACSLYEEQTNGISLHRASEYSDVVRR